MIRLSALIITICTVVGSCKKEETPVPDAVKTPFSFTELKAEPSEIYTGGTSKITAVANGDDLKYEWSVSHGDLFGSGISVTYGASPCCVGGNGVTCKVTDKHGNTETKTVIIQVSVPQPI